MNICEDVLATVFATIEEMFVWSCRPLPDGRRVAIRTNRMTADSEPVVLYATSSLDQLTVSDGGETLNRLGDGSFDLEDKALAAIWEESLHTYRLSTTDGRVFIQTSISRAPYALSRFADALVALDALRVLGVPSTSRSKTLADEVGDYLSGLFDARNVKRSPGIRLRGGISITPALSVSTPARPRVLVQPGASRATSGPFDHAFTTMNLARRGGFTHEELLVVLGGRVQSWPHAKLRALADEAFVGFWDSRGQIERFLRGETPDDPLMTPPGFDVPLYA
jgi:hypothetical protein